MGRHVRGNINKKEEKPQESESLKPWQKAVAARKAKAEARRKDKE